MLAQCPHCHERFTIAPKPRKGKPAAGGFDPSAVVDTSTMTDAELHAHYKKTAPLEDIRFWLRVGTLSPEVREGFQVLEAAILNFKTLNRAALYRDICDLQDHWRIERNRAELVERLTEKIEELRTEATA